MKERGRKKKKRRRRWWPEMLHGKKSFCRMFLSLKRRFGGGWGLRRPLKAMEKKKR